MGSTGADLIQTIDERLRVNTTVGAAQVLDAVGEVLRPERIGQRRRDRLGGGLIPVCDETQVTIGSHRGRSGAIGSHQAGRLAVWRRYLKSRAKVRLRFQPPWRVVANDKAKREPTLSDPSVGDCRLVSTPSRCLARSGLLAVASALFSVLRLAGRDIGSPSVVEPE